jgi:hypothetical protein
MGLGTKNVIVFIHVRRAKTAKQSHKYVNDSSILVHIKLAAEQQNLLRCISPTCDTSFP